MSEAMDLSEFFDTFFDEADELLEAMEQDLLHLDPLAPDMDALAAIFRAAHSIKGGAATFGCFEELATVTHTLENILDPIRHGEIALQAGMIDLFLETKDVLSAQVAAYRNQTPPDEAAYARICGQLQELARSAGAAVSVDVPVRVRIERLADKDVAGMVHEMALMGTVLHERRDGSDWSVWLQTSVPEDDLAAVCCFVVDASQVRVTREPLPAVGGAQPALPASSEAASSDVHDGGTAVASAPGPGARDATRDGPAKERGTIRVGVEKVDQIINLVGELVITQAMLAQSTQGLDAIVHDRLLGGIEQLDRNARHLQEAVMSIRMVPMDYVFSRFPRVVRENAGRLGKKIRLETYGQATELDKSLIERIIDPLTHLVRNSLDHGIESPAEREAQGKPAEGVLTLTAQHSGGHVVIEVRDDGAGLNRDRILAKARAAGMAVSEATPDEELWQLVFAPGFSTAEQVTDISGRGVGMDVVRRNIQALGGHVQLSSQAGAGTTTRIVLPLTLAILDGMSVKVGAETFILPLGHVNESLQASVSQIRELSAGEQVLHVRGEYLSIVPLHQVFQVPDAETDPTRAIAVIVQAEELRFALLVDQLVGQHQVVVKNLEANYRKVAGISAATILGDGSVALIVDIFALMRQVRPVATADLTN
ncbi:chemotaxis protein CheW [Castellaniella sp.]|uniref:chemotaxis protein CheW n=1 Tax=Castellaniella sp. TaxID=1955812 RepID=UPI00355E42BD